MSWFRSMLAEGATEIGSHRKEFVWLSALALVHLFTYSMVRPPTESLFLEEYGHERLPEAWLIVFMVMVPAVEIYMRLITRIGPLRMFAASALVSGAILTRLLFLQRTGIHGVSYELYIWKEIYIILLVESFWTVSNIIFPVRTARWIYGFFLAAGAVGSVAGNVAAGLSAEWLGSQASLWLVVPVLGLAALLAILFQRTLPTKPFGTKTLGRGLWGVPRLLHQSPYLAWMALLVVLTQVVITLIDYEYNGVVKAAFPDLDTRTEVISIVYGTINAGSFFLQMVTGPILRLLGVAGGLFAVPLLLASTVVGYLLWPVFIAMAVVKVASKSLDYSLFRAAKEILYIPLPLSEKTEGKALIDIFLYRSTKGGSYPLLRSISGSGLLTVPHVTLAFIGVWMGVTAVIVRRYRRTTEADQTTAPEMDAS